MAIITSAVKRASGAFTRPADTTAYTSGDLMANSTTAINVIPIMLACGRGGLRIPYVRLEKDSAIVTNATFRVHFFENSPTVSNGDNGAFLVNQAGYIGYVDLPTMTASSNGAYAVAHSDTAATFMGGVANGLYGYSTGSYIYALLEARAAFTPVSASTFTLNINIEKF